MNNIIKIGDTVEINSGCVNSFQTVVTFKHHLHKDRLYVEGIGDPVLIEQMVKVETILSPYKELAVSAHNGTSFDPDKRGRELIKSCEGELIADLEKIASEEDKEAYKTGYIKHLTAWLQAKSRCISTMITGPANFPVRRAEKANQSAHNRSVEFSEYRDKAFKAIERKKLAGRSEQQVLNDEFNLISKQMTSSALTIIGIDNGTERGYSRALFVTNMTKRIETVANRGNVKLLSMCLDLLKELNNHPLATKPIVTDKHKVWGLLEIVEAKREKLVDLQNSDSNEIEFSEGKIVLNYQLDRIQIIYNGKPPQETINKLKSKAFRWSPSQMAWQRHLNNAGKYAVSEVTGYKF